MDQLKQALAQALGRPAPEASAAPAAADGLPDPLQSPWVARLRQLCADLPAAPTLGQLTQRSDALARALKEQGRQREARELTALKEAFLREREREAWARIKARFAELELPERAYRALKQEGADAEKVLPRLAGRRGDALRGMGADRVRDALSKS